MIIMFTAETCNELGERWSVFFMEFFLQHEICQFYHIIVFPETIMEQIEGE